MTSRPTGGRLLRRLAGGIPTGMAAGLVVLVLTILAIGWTLDHNLRAIDRLLEQILEVEEPISAAAYEMEINVLGAGLGVSSYLSTGDPQHRVRVHKDETDFRRFRADYEHLSVTAREKELGAQIDTHSEPFFRLGAALLDSRDELHGLLTRLTEDLAEMDELLDARIQAQVDPDSPDGWAKLMESTAIEADVAEIRTWLAAYVSAPTARHRECMTESIHEARQHLVAFRALQLAPAEREQAVDVERLLDDIVAQAERALASHDSLRDQEQAFLVLRGRLDDTLDEGVQALAKRAMGSMHPQAMSAIRRLEHANLFVLALGVVTCLAAAVLIAHRSMQLGAANEELRHEVERRQQSDAARGHLVQQLLSAHEEERGRLARELHDQLGGDLSTVMLGLNEIARRAPEAAPGQAVRSQLEQLQALTGKLIEHAHTIAWELRPVGLDDLGLHGALSNYVEEWMTHSKVTVDFESDMEGQRLPEPVETALYRVAQEALTNVRKHARAETVSLTLQRRGHEVVLVVEDDGVGFVPEHFAFPSASNRRLGLSGMRERMALAGGMLTLESTPGQGTTLVVRITLA